MSIYGVFDFGVSSLTIYGSPVTAGVFAGANLSFAHGI